LSLQEFPWFRDDPVGKLLNVELPPPRHLYWPDLDVDLAVESIEHPERFQLISKTGLTKAFSRPAAKSCGGRLMPDPLGITTK
jgi:hypothetical protein